MKIRFHKAWYYQRFGIKRYWSNKIIHIELFRCAMIIDLRTDILSDMTNGKVKAPK